MKELTTRQKQVILALADHNDWVGTKTIAAEIGAQYPGGIPTLLGNLHLATFVERKCIGSHTHWKLTELGLKMATTICPEDAYSQTTLGQDKVGNNQQIITNNKGGTLSINTKNIKRIIIEFV